MLRPCLRCLIDDFHALKMSAAMLSARHAFSLFAFDGYFRHYFRPLLMPLRFRHACFRRALRHAFAITPIDCLRMIY